MTGPVEPLKDPATTDGCRGDCGWSECRPPCPAAAPLQPQPLPPCCDHVVCTTAWRWLQRQREECVEHHADLLATVEEEQDLRLAAVTELAAVQRQLDEAREQNESLRAQLDDALTECRHEHEMADVEGRNAARARGETNEVRARLSPLLRQLDEARAENDDLRLAMRPGDFLPTIRRMREAEARIEAVEALCDEAERRDNDAVVHTTDLRAALGSPEPQPQQPSDEQIVDSLIYGRPDPEVDRLVERLVGGDEISPAGSGEPKPPGEPR